MPGGRNPHSTDRIGGWAGAKTGLVTLKGGGGTLVPVGNPTTIPPSSSAQPIHYTNYAILAYLYSDSRQAPIFQKNVLPLSSGWRKWSSKRTVPIN